MSLPTGKLLTLETTDNFLRTLRELLVWFEICSLYSFLKICYLSVQGCLSLSLSHYKMLQNVIYEPELDYIYVLACRVLNKALITFMEKIFSSPALILHFSWRESPGCGVMTELSALPTIQEGEVGKSTLYLLTSI